MTRLGIASGRAARCLSRLIVARGLALGLGSLMAASPSRAEAISVLLLPERVDAEALKPSSPAVRAMIAGVRSAMISSLAAGFLRPTAHEAFDVLDQNSLSGVSVPDEVGDATASDRAILDKLQARMEAGETSADVLVRITLYARAIAAEPGQSHSMDLALAANLSYRDVASGRPLGGQTPDLRVPFEGCGERVDRDCVLRSLSDMAERLGRDAGVKLAQHLAAFLARDGSAAAAPGTPATDNAAVPDQAVGDATMGIESDCSLIPVTYELVFRLVPQDRLSMIEDGLAESRCAKRLDVRSSDLSETVYVYTAEIDPDPLAAGLQSLLAGAGIAAAPVEEGVGRFVIDAQ